MKAKVEVDPIGRPDAVAGVRRIGVPSDTGIVAAAIMHKRLASSVSNVASETQNIAASRTGLQVDPLARPQGGFGCPLLDTIEVSALQVLQLRGGGRDAFGFVFKVDGTISYDVVGGGGAVSETGEFVAGTTVATFPDSLETDWQGYVGYTDIIVGTGAPASIVVTPPAEPVPTTQQGQYLAAVYDASGNVVEGADVQWFVVGGVDAEVDSVTGIVTAGCTPGTFAGAILASHGLVEQTADLMVVEGGAPVESLTASPASVEVAAGGEVQLGVVVTDSCGHDASGGVTWEALDGGDVDQAGLFTADCATGTYTNAVRVSAAALEDFVDIVVAEPQPATIAILPETATVGATMTAQYSATVLDGCGGEIVDGIEFSASPNAGSIDPVTGQFTASCTVGDYPSGVTAMYGDLTAATDISVSPGPLVTLTLEPSHGSVETTSETLFSMSGEDACGNDAEVSPIWSTEISGALLVDGPPGSKNLTLSCADPGVYEAGVHVCSRSRRTVEI